MLPLILALFHVVSTNWGKKYTSYYASSQKIVEFEGGLNGKSPVESLVLTLR
jgi:hypothetical protein